MVELCLNLWNFPWILMADPSATNIWIFIWMRTWSTHKKCAENELEIGVENRCGVHIQFQFALQSFNHIWHYSHSTWFKRTYTQHNSVTILQIFSVLNFFGASLQIFRIKFRLMSVMPKKIIKIKIVAILFNFFLEFHIM